MGILGWILLGLIGGAIAKAIMPGDDPGGIIVTMIIGVVGAVLAGFLAAAIFDADPVDEFFDISTWLTAIVGSLIVTWDGWRGGFHRLAVRPDHRRRGLATELVRIGEEQLRARGAVRLAAIVARDETAALELWEGLGYTFQPEHLRFIRDFD